MPSTSRRLTRKWLLSERATANVTNVDIPPPIPPIVYALEAANREFWFQNDSFPARALVSSDDYLDFALYLQDLAAYFGSTEDQLPRPLIWNDIELERDPTCSPFSLRVMSENAIYSIEVEWKSGDASHLKDLEPWEPLNP